MQQERWKLVEDCPRYKVSDYGRVWDTKRDVEVKQQLAGIPKYRYVNMQGEEKRHFLRVHRLVAIAFVEGRSEEFDVVDHRDRDKFNNHYSNLRWTDNKGNQRNLENNLYIGEEYLKDFVQKYEAPEVAYSYIASSMVAGLRPEDAVARYEVNLEYGLKRIEVEWKGQKVFLFDLCKRYDKDYFKVSARLKQGWDIWNALFEVPHEQPHQFEVPSKTGVTVWYRSKTQLAEELGVLTSTVNSRLETCTYLEDLVSYDLVDKYRQTIEGFTGTIPELCKHFGVEQSMVESRRTRQGMSLEEALLSGKQRIKVVYLNGERMTTKCMYEALGVNAKKASRVRSRNGFTIEETLEHFGVNLSGVSLIY